MRTIKIYFKRAPFYNALIRTNLKCSAPKPYLLPKLRGVVPLEFPAEDFPMNGTPSMVTVLRRPYCNGKEFFRSRRRGLKDRLFHYVLFPNPYRCATCDGRLFRSSQKHLPRAQMGHQHIEAT